MSCIGIGAMDICATFFQNINTIKIMIVRAHYLEYSMIVNNQSLQR